MGEMEKKGGARGQMEIDGSIGSLGFGSRRLRACGRTRARTGDAAVAGHPDECSDCLQRRACAPPTLPAPRVQRMFFTTNTSVRTVIFWDPINGAPGLGTEVLGHRTACPTNTRVRTVFCEDFIVRWTRRGRGGVWTAKTVKRPRQQPAQPPIRQFLGAADAQTAHPATFSTAPTHQRLGSANAETTPAGAPAAAADRTQRPDATCEGTNG